MGAISSLAQCEDLGVDYPFVKGVTDLSALVHLNRFSFFAPGHFLRLRGAIGCCRLEFLKHPLPASLDYVALQLASPDHYRAQITEVADLVEAAGLGFYVIVVGERD